MRSHVAKILLCFTLAAFFAARVAAAAEYHGTVTFGGLPLPGATITATQGGKKFSAVSDLGGVYHFDDLPNGEWTIEVEMQGFAVIHTQVNVTADMPAGKWELTLLPADQLMARSKAQKNPVIAQPALVAPPPAANGNASAAASAPVEVPPAPPAANEQSADGYLVNGSVNNAATSRYSTNPAFGNTRAGGRALYNGGLAVTLDSSATDARQFAISGAAAAKPASDVITSNVYIGGPLRIPRLLPRGPNFYVNYTWTRQNNAVLNTGLVPTIDERMGNLSGLLNAQGQPLTIYNPATGTPYLNNQVPVSSQAAALLALYPLPNPNISSASGYNYQAPVLNSAHVDALSSRIDNAKIGNKDFFFGGFNFQSQRASTVSLFDFVDATGTLGIGGNIHWQHRFSTHVFLYSAYTFSRSRTEVTPNFDSRVNVSGPNDANIGGNDQNPANWGPPALGFTSGISTLSDGNSAYNRSRTDGVSESVGIYRGRHNISIGGDFNKRDYNDYFESNPRGSFTFTGAATAQAAQSTTSGSDLADFLIGIPDTSSIAFGNAAKYLRENVYDAYVNDDWRVLPALTINAGMRWEYSAPITELHNQLVNLDINPGFTAGAPVLASNPVGPVTGAHYPASLVRPDRRGIEPRIGLAWRPIPASTIVVRGSYGITRDTSVYQSLVLQMAQQAPLSTSFTVSNGAACPLTLANGFSCASADTFALDPNYRIGYAQTWSLAVQRDLPAALQIVATYTGIKGTHGAQQFLPNTNPIGATNPCPSCPTDFVYRTSGGNSTRQSGQVQLRRRLRNGFTANLEYTYSKSIDDDAVLGGQGYVTTSAQSQNAASGATAASTGPVAQNWLDLRAERARSTFDQRHLLSLTGQYTSGEGLGGGTLMSGWKGRVLKEWTVTGTFNGGTGLPETPTFPFVVPGTGYETIRPSLTGAPIYISGGAAHLNASAYEAPVAGEWGTAGRDSITGPDQISLNSQLARTFRPHGKTYLDFNVNSTNVLNHPVFSTWITSWNGASQTNAEQFGRPLSANGMRTLQTTIRFRF